MYIYNIQTDLLVHSQLILSTHLTLDYPQVATANKIFCVRMME